MSEEATRMMTAAMPAAADRTLMAPADTDPMRTQLGGTAVCPICKTSTPIMETYCGDCGFLLSSSAPAEAVLPAEVRAPAELVETESGRKHRLKAGVNTIGRQGTDILISDGTISRVHARLTLEGDKLTVEDMGSSNGTKVGDLRIGADQPAVAPAGTVLKFGNWTAKFEVNEPAFADTTIMLSNEERTVALNKPAGSEGAAAVLPAAVLRCLEGPGGDVTLAEGVTNVGRKAENEMIMAGDPYISGRHALFTVLQGQVSITDVGSTNGSMVNGQKLAPNQPQELAEGDEIKLGQSRYRFEFASPSAGLTAGPDDLYAALQEADTLPAEGQEQAP